MQRITHTTATARHPFALARLSALITLALSAPLAQLAMAAEPGTSASDATAATMVVTGSRVKHASFDLPAAIDVVDTARLTEGYNRVNLSDPLAAVPGIVALNRQNYASDLQISSRGFGARSAFGVRGVRLISDGIPATMPDGQGQAATFNLDNAERIEVLRGPFSVIYGNHSGGVVQLFTREGKGPTTVETTVSTGSYGTWKTDVAAQGKIGETGGVGYVIDASRFKTDGYRDHSAATRDQGMVKLSLHPTDNDDLHLIANQLHQNGTQDALGLNWADVNANPRGAAQVALDYNTRKNIDHVQAGLNYEHRYGDNAVQMTVYGGSRQVIQYQSIPPGPQANVKHSGGVIDFDRQFSGLNLRWIGKMDLAGGKLTTTLGMDYDKSEDDRKGYTNFTGTSPSYVLGIKGVLRRNETDSVTSQSPYLQSEWQSGAWVLNGGIRRSSVSFKVADKFLSNGDDSGSLNFSATTPTLGVLYKLTPTLNIYLSAAKGFESPTLNELFYSGTAGSFNFNLKAATSNHLETGIKAQLSRDTQINAALFQVKTSDELVVDIASGGRTSYKNATRTLRQGIEISAVTRYTPSLSSHLAVSVLRATYDQSFVTGTGVSAVTIAAGKRLPGVPGYSLFGDLVWQGQGELSGLSAAVEAIAQGKIYVEDSNLQAAASSYAILNARIGAEQSLGGWKFKEYLRVNNLFDKTYIGSVIVSDSNGRYYEPAPGRNWMVGASVSYAF